MGERGQSAPIDPAPVAAFLEAHRLRKPTAERLLDLNSEAGELAKEYLKATHYGARDFLPSRAWEEELGDVAFCLVALAVETGVDLDLALEQSLEKLADRISRTGAAGSDAPP